MLFLLAAFVSQVSIAFANTEKVIFLGPETLQISIEHPTLEDLKLDALSPQDWSLRTHVKAEFPTNASKNGLSTWMILYKLRESQRYEVRICWAATEPTSFRLDTYPPSTVFETPELITSLAKYAESQQGDEVGSQDLMLRSNNTYGNVSSILFLHIQAAADYFTMNHTLMENVPPVFVDIILDPFVFNVVPRSLLQTAAYILVLAVAGWYLSKYVNGWIRAISEEDISSVKKYL